MTQLKDAAAAETWELMDASVAMERLDLAARLEFGAARSRQMTGGERPLMRRCLARTDARAATVEAYDGSVREVLMFGSNDYLGLARHPTVIEESQKALAEHGLGTPGSPLFNGYSGIHRTLEERLAALKGEESALLFSSGYSANVGLLGALLSRHDVAVFDRGAHGSLWDGARFSRAKTRVFRHNDPADLDDVLADKGTARDQVVSVDGVYSMDGDAAPVDQMLEICRRRGAFLIVDDAHGTGITGANGRGTCELYGIEGQVDATVGTLGKALGAIGAWVSGSEALIEYLRCFGRSHLFSTSLPPAIVGGVLAALDVMEAEPERREHLKALVARAADGLRPLGLTCEPAAAIISVPLPRSMDVRRAIEELEQGGIFLNYSVFPAVARGEQRFRISITADHHEADVDRLVEVLHEVWRSCAGEEAGDGE